MGLHKGQTNNPHGRTKGSKNERTVQWEALADSITGMHAERFNAILLRMMESEDEDQQEKGCRLYMEALEYFKPKQSRIQHAGDKEDPIQIIISDKI